MVYGQDSIFLRPLKASYATPKNRACIDDVQLARVSTMTGKHFTDFFGFLSLHFTKQEA